MLSTSEELRLGRAIGANPEPVADQILRRSGFDRFLEPFVADLGAASTLASAGEVVAKHGTQLWRAAVDRAQGRGPEGGDLPRSDDRPLYWARLQLTRALRHWSPRFPLAAGERGALERTLERASRGQLDVRFPAGPGVRRMLVSGFDPFGLDGSGGRAIRNGNPSGAIALALDGALVDTPSGVVAVESAIFPVRWKDFELGMAEDTFGPFMQPGPQRLHAAMTISQGGRRMDIEAWNGCHHTGEDNNLVDPCGRHEDAEVHAPGCLIRPPDRWVPFEAPQWTRTTLPHDAMIAAGTGPFRVFLRTSVTEFAGDDSRATVSRRKGPSSPAARARRGSGGSFLSNEIAYRVTLLRDVFRLAIPAGHMHVPVMSVFGRGNRFDITDATFEARRDAIVRQAIALVHVVARVAAASPGD